MCDGGQSRSLKRRLLNRQSACVSRERKRQFLSDVLRRNSELEEENCRLRNHLSVLLGSSGEGAQPAPRCQDTPDAGLCGQGGNGNRGPSARTSESRVMFREYEPTAKDDKHITDGWSGPVNRMHSSFVRTKPALLESVELASFKPISLVLILWIVDLPSQ